MLVFLSARFQAGRTLLRLPPSARVESSGFCGNPRGACRYAFVVDAAVVEALGGKFEATSYCLGDCAAAVITRLPEGIAASAHGLAAGPSTHIRPPTTPLLTVAEADHAQTKGPGSNRMLLRPVCRLRRYGWLVQHAMWIKWVETTAHCGLRSVGALSQDRARFGAVYR